MSKKPKKQSRKVSASRPADVPAVKAAAAPMSSATRSDAEFNPDYSQTIKDLRRIGILAGSLFGLLIVLALVLLR